MVQDHFGLETDWFRITSVWRQIGSGSLQTGDRLVQDHFGLETDWFRITSDLRQIGSGSLLTGDRLVDTDWGHIGLETQTGDTLI